MYPIKQSTAITVPFFAHDVSGDAVTGLTDGSFTKRISKNGAAFGAMTVVITELELGWYSIPLSAVHSDAVGILTVIFTNAGAKQVNLQWRVDVRLPDDHAFPAVTGRSIQVETDGHVHADLKEWLGVAPNALVSGRVDGSVGAMAANVITAAAINAAAFTAAKFAAGAFDAVWIVTARILTAATNITSTGGTTVPQTGDSFARIGAAGANLNDLGGMSTAMRAQIESEVNDALVAIHLDHLLAVDYDPAAKPGVATALLNELVENNAGVSRFTAAALDQVWAVAIRIVTAATNITSTGGTTVPQSGDSFPRLPAALVGGRMDSDVGAMQAGVITAAAFAAAAITAAKFGAGAIDANALATDAALEIADALLNRDMSAVSDTNSRTPLNALRKLMNRWAIVGSTLTVNKEDDTTPAYTQTVTSDAAADPITVLDTV